MGLVAVSAGVTAGGGNILELLSPVGPAIGGIFVAIALIVLFAYLTLLDAADVERPEVRQTLLAVIVPLSFAFGGTILYSILQII